MSSVHHPQAVYGLSNQAIYTINPPSESPEETVRKTILTALKIFAPVLLMATTPLPVGIELGLASIFALSFLEKISCCCRRSGITSQTPTTIIVPSPRTAFELSTPRHSMNGIDLTSGRNMPQTTTVAASGTTRTGPYQPHIPVGTRGAKKETPPRRQAPVILYTDPSNPLDNTTTARGSTDNHVVVGSEKNKTPAKLTFFLKQTLIGK
jgi:hypothetical protein